jgi:hypothetical protein
MKASGNEAKLSAAADSLKQMIIVKPEKSSVYSVKDVLKLFQVCFPLFCDWNSIIAAEAG